MALKVADFCGFVVTFVDAALFEVTVVVFARVVVFVVWMLAPSATVLDVAPSTDVVVWTDADDAVDVSFFPLPPPHAAATTAATRAAMATLLAPLGIRPP